MRSRPHLNQLNVVSGNLTASIAFYRRLGVDIPDDTVWSTPTGIHHVSASDSAMDRNPVDLELDSIPFAAHWNSGWRGRQDLAGRVVIGFHVSSRDDVDELYTELTNEGYVGLQAPYDAFWGSRYAVIEDPDGTAVGLMSPRSSELRSRAPDQL
ncbi:MAG: VOC family protein [Vulcanimicrobiaceae bacterium]